MNYNLDYIFNHGGVLKSNGYALYAEAIILSDPLKAAQLHDHDLVQDIFTKNTNFGHARDINVYYDHGMHPQIGDEEYGYGVMKMNEMDAGKIFFEGELDRRMKYVDYVKELVEMGKLGCSTGVAPHLYKSRPIGKGINEIMHWVASDMTLTTEPCEPRTIAHMKGGFAPSQLYTLKSYTPVLYDFSKNNMISLLKVDPAVADPAAANPTTDAAAAKPVEAAPDVKALQEKFIQADSVADNFKDRNGDMSGWEAAVWVQYFEVLDQVDVAKDAISDFYESEAAANDAAQAAKDAANGGMVTGGGGMAGTKNLKIGAAVNAQRMKKIRELVKSAKTMARELNVLYREVTPSTSEDAVTKAVRIEVTRLREEERKLAVEKELQLKAYL